MYNRKSIKVWVYGIKLDNGLCKGHNFYKEVVSLEEIKMYL